MPRCSSCDTSVSGYELRRIPNSDQLCCVSCTTESCLDFVDPSFVFMIIPNRDRSNFDITASAKVGGVEVEFHQDWNSIKNHFAENKRKLEERRKLRLVK